MPVTLHHIANQVLGNGGPYPLTVHRVGAQSLLEMSHPVAVYNYGVQLLHVYNMPVHVRNVGAQLLVPAEVDPETGGYLHPEKSIIKLEVDDLIYTDVIFPLCVSYGSTSVPRYETQKSEVLSGDETRNSRWQYPKHEYNINMENLPADEVAEIMNIWHICSGDHIGFMFLDPIDHTSNNATVLSGGTVTSEDQDVASAVGGKTNYPLYKYYQHKGYLKQRLIRYPKADTVLVKVGHRETTQFEIDTTNPDETLKFTQPISDLVLTCTLAGDVISRDDVGDWSNHFAVGDFVEMSGWSNAGNNIGASNPARVQAIDGPDMTLETGDGDVYGSGDETSVAVTFNSGLPPTGKAITAGFYFYVPVRFDEGDSATSEITGGYQDNVFANFDDIKLKEVFE